MWNTFLVKEEFMFGYSFNYIHLHVYYFSYVDTGNSSIVANSVEM